MLRNTYNVGSAIYKAHKLCNYSIYLRTSRLLHDVKTSQQETQRTHSIEANLDNIKPAKRSKFRAITELMRLNKPTGTLLTLTPALWSVGMATPDTLPFPDLKTMAIFTAGAIVARGMGCTVNDILDRKIDRQVERTKNRPIACGDISTKEAFACLVVQSTLGLYILCLNNLEVIKLGFVSVALMAAYPMFKRFTNWPQVMLGMTFNWGVLMGYAAIKGSLGLEDFALVLPLYAGANLWTLYYDTIYAHQDKTDDAIVGVKSSALFLGDKTKPFLHSMSRCMFLTLALAGLLSAQEWPYFLAIAGTSLYQINQVRYLNLNDVSDCARAFDKQKYIGITILSGVLLSVVLKSHNAKNKAKNTDDPVDSIANQTVTAK